MDIDSGSVKEGLIYLSSVISNIQEARKYIASASSNLDRRISNPYSEVKELLRKIELNEQDIVDLCNDFIEEAESTIDFISSSSSQSEGETIDGVDGSLITQETNTNGKALMEAYGITYDDLLLLGRGPINPELLTMKDVEKIQQAKTRKANRNTLLSMGFCSTDVERVLNGEISVEDLYQEIYSDYCNGNPDRFKALLDAVQLNDYYFNRSETELLLAEKQERLDYLLSESSQEEKNKLLQEYQLYNLVVEEAEYDPLNKIHRYKFENSGEIIEFTESEWASLVATRDYLGEKVSNYDSSRQQEIEQLETEIGNLNALLSDSTRREFLYHTMEELEAGIADLDAQVAQIDRLLSGEDLDYASFDNPNTDWCCIKTDNNTYVVINSITGKRKTYNSLEELIADGFNMLPSDTKTRSVLDAKSLNDWFGINNTSFDTTGWTCIKIGANKYVLMNAHRSCVDLNGNSSYESFTAEELISNGFYLPEDHRVMLDEDGDLVQVLQYSQEDDLSSRLDGQEINVWFPLLNETIGNEWDSDSSALIARRNELIQEKDALLEVKSDVDSNTSYNLKYARYTLQPDYEEKSKFNPGPAEDITYYRNSWHIIINAFGIEAGRYTFMDTKEFRGALLSRMLNGDVIILPDFEGGASNVCSDEGQEYYFYGDERQMFFNEFQLWANASYTDKKTGQEARAIYPSEIQMFNYICNTEGYEAGYEYLMSMRGEFDRRYAAIQTARDSDFARSNVLAGTLSLIVDPFVSLANAGVVMRKKANGDTVLLTNLYNPASTWHTTIASDLGRNYGAGWEKAYNILYSLDQSMMNLLIAYATGGSSLSVTLSSTFVMGLPVFNASYYDAKTKGIDDDTAILLSGLKATTEIVMESFSLTHLLGLEAAYENALASGTIVSAFSDKISMLPAKFQPIAEKLLLTSYCMISQGLIGGEEELATEILDNIWDFALAKETSLVYVKYNEYKKLHPNCSDFEASAFAISQVMDAGWDAFTSGFIAEALMGGFGHVNTSTMDLSPYSGMRVNGANDNVLHPSIPTNINPAQQIDTPIGENIDLREDTKLDEIEGHENSISEDGSQGENTQASPTQISVQENTNIPESIRDAIKNGTSVNGRIEIPASTLINNNIKLRSGESIQFDEAKNKFLRVDSNGIVIAEIDPELFYSSNLRDALVRLERNTSTGMWVDRITGYQTPINPTYIWLKLLAHLNGEFKNRQSRGLHSFESFATQLKDGTIQIKIGTDTYTGVDASVDTATGELVIKGTDGSILGRIAPDSKGFFNVYWEYTAHPRRGHNTTLFPAGLDLQAIADEFNAIPDKVPTHLQITERSNGTFTYNAYYEYEYTIPGTGEKITVIFEVNNGEIASMYPAGESFDSTRPNTFDVVTRPNNSSTSSLTVEQIADQLCQEYADKELTIETDDSKCTIKVGDDMIEVSREELGSESTREKIEMLTDPVYIATRNSYREHITGVNIVDGKYQITTKYGDIVILTLDQISSHEAVDILGKMTDSDYLKVRSSCSSKIDSVTYDIVYDVYVVKTVNGETITFTHGSLWNGDAESMIRSATDPDVIAFKQRNQDKYISFSYDGYNYTIVVNQYGDIIQAFDLFADNVEAKLDMLNNQEYLMLRAAYDGKFVSVSAGNGEYIVSIKGVKSRHSYTFPFSESSLGTEMLDQTINMYLSEEYDDFYNNMIYANNYATSITVENGKYVITRLSGEQIIVEQGGLGDVSLQNQLFADHVIETCINGISSWSQNGDSYTIRTIYGDVITLTVEQMKNPNVYNMIVTMTTSKGYVSLRQILNGVIQSSTINGEGKLVVTTIYGDTFILSQEIINSDNLFYEMVTYRYRHEAVLQEDGTYRIVDKYGQEYILTESELADDAKLLSIYDLMIEHENTLVNEWLINNIENMPGQITPQQQAAIDAKVDAIATRIGATRAEVYSAIRNGLKNVVSESSFGNRVSMDTLKSILGSWIKNQHETNSSNGMMNPRARRRLEDAIFFVPSTINARDAAVYGMLFPNLDTATDQARAISYYRDGPGSWYGSGSGSKTQVVIIYDKAKIMDNTTITIGDSLDYAYYNGGTIQSGSPAANPEFTGSFDGFLDSVSSLDEIENATLETFAPKYGGPGDQYIEIQVHGRYAHSVDVIQEVIFLVQPDPVVTQMLDRMNIPWRVI